MDNHEATQHEFTRRCLQFFYADIAENELDALKEDLPVFAEGVNHFGGYDLDKRIAALTAERDALRVALKNMLYIFDNGYDKADSLGRMRCDEARRVLGE